jgi:hypothetical protein
MILDFDRRSIEVRIDGFQVLDAYMRTPCEPLCAAVSAHTLGTQVRLIVRRDDQTNSCWLLTRRNKEFFRLSHNNCVARALGKYSGSNDPPLFNDRSYMRYLPQNVCSLTVAYIQGGGGGGRYLNLFVVFACHFVIIIVVVM